MLIVVTTFTAFLCGITGGYLFGKPRKRQMPPNTATPKA